MTEETCKKCGRQLIEEESKYCPHCNAKRAERWKIISKIAIGVAGCIGAVAGKKYLSDKNKKNI